MIHVLKSACDPGGAKRGQDHGQGQGQGQVQGQDQGQGHAVVIDGPGHSVRVIIGVDGDPGT